MRRYPNQHMYMVPIDRPSVDRHLMSSRNFAQKLPSPLPNVSAQHRKPVFRDPHDVILAVPDRVTSRLRILHNRSVASRSPKGEGFTDPLSGTLNLGIPSPGSGTSEEGLGLLQAFCKRLRVGSVALIPAKSRPVHIHACTKCRPGQRGQNGFQVELGVNFR
jgi:hypothetical protein